MRRGFVAGFIAIACWGSGPVSGALAQGEDPPFAGWPALLGSTVTGFTPSTFAPCADGDPACVDATITRMRDRLAVLDAGCDHRALFLRNYLTVTEHYAQLRPGFFADDRFLAHEDAVFAQLYFDAFDAHAAGRRQDVPEAWRIAFDAARDRTVDGGGDLLLGINAHVQRDMPFMLAGLGLAAPDGSSRKVDHDRFNAVLNASYDDVYRRATVMDDPSLANANPPGPLDGFAAFQAVAAWREGVWRNAERLVRARNATERAQVAASIEQNAALTARAIATARTYRPPLTDSRARLANCRSRPTDPGPGSPPADLDGRDLVRVDLGGLRLRVRR